VQKPSDSFVASFVRGLSVIRAFGEGAQELTLSEVAAKAGLTRAGARRILLTLESIGYVAQDGRDFRLTPRVLELGYAYISSMPIWRSAQPLLEQLVAQVGETCSVSVLDDTEVVYVLRIPVHRILSVGVSIGSRLPAHATSMGRILLAYETPETLDAYFHKAKFTTYTRQTITDPKKLRREIEAARQAGWSYVESELEENIVGISAPVMDRRGKAVAAVNISSNTGRVTRKKMEAKLLPALLKTAEQMNLALAMGR
jgi:IclR family transcriptional regulator, pca regulon regulatory protein